MCTVLAPQLDIGQCLHTLLQYMGHVRVATTGVRDTDTAATTGVRDTDTAETMAKKNP